MVVIYRCIRGVLRILRIITEKITIATRGNTDISDITKKVAEHLRNTGLKEGSVLVFLAGATAGVTTIEYEPGLLSDYPALFERIAPESIRYKHDDTWHDGNGHSHVRASLQGASLTVPFSDGKLLLGTWQQIVIIDFDTHPRNRTVILQFTGI